MSGAAFWNRSAFRAHNTIFHLHLYRLPYTWCVWDKTPDDRYGKRPFVWKLYTQEVDQDRLLFVATFGTMRRLAQRLSHGPSTCKRSVLKRQVGIYLGRTDYWEAQGPTTSSPLVKEHRSLCACLWHPTGQGLMRSALRIWFCFVFLAKLILSVARVFSWIVWLRI